VARQRRPSTRGFTLIEVMIALVIVALITVVSVRGLRSFAKTDLRATATRMAGSIRYLFDRASTTGRVHRLVLDFDNRKYWAEVSDDQFILEAGKETEESRKKQAEKLAKEEEIKREAAEKEASFGSSQIPTRYMPKPFTPKRAKFDAFRETAVKPIALKSGVVMADIYTPRLLKPLAEGKGYVYFFPMGMTEAAVIHLSDGKETFYSLIVHPLTGRVTVKNSYVDPNTGDQVDDSGKVVVP
jgi:general secretion pathway protein H